MPDIAEPAEESDLGEGTYIAGEEEAEGYEDPVNDTPEPTYVDVDALPDEDAVKKPKGIDYALEDGYLRVNTGLNGELFAWATVYATEPDKLVEFAYDHNGLRVQKVVKTTAETVTTEYTLHGKLVVHQKVTTISAGGTTATEEMHFFYDAQSRPAMVEFRGKLYIYRHNLQGDIVAILDSNGNSVVEYDYDAWGRPTRAWSENSSGLESSLISEYAELKELNPFRYRGYVWDEETGLYYLRSRYYDPVWGRFVNADPYMGSVSKLASHNRYSYCLNVPNCMSDMNGNVPKRLTHTNIHDYRRHMIPANTKVTIIDIDKRKNHTEVIFLTERLLGTGEKETSSYELKFIRNDQLEDYEDELFYVDIGKKDKDNFTYGAIGAAAGLVAGGPAGAVATAILFERISTWSSLSIDAMNNQFRDLKKVTTYGIMYFHRTTVKQMAGYTSEMEEQEYYCLWEGASFVTYIPCD